MIKNFNKPGSIVLLIPQILLSTICLVHFFALVTYLLHEALHPCLFPVSVLAAIGLNFLFAGRLGSDKRSLTLAAAVSLLILAVSVWLAWFYFDLSWDGQAYHQAAVYNLAGKWNPLFQQLETPDHINDRSVLFFPKSSWIFGAALLRLFGTVEPGKAYNFIILFAAAGVVYPLCRNFKMPAWKAGVFTLLILLNPVVWSELTGYLNDGDLYLFLVIYLASIILWLRDPKPIFISIGLMAAVCLVNVKFTGLVFFLITSFFVLIYILFREKDGIKPFLVSHLLAGIIAVFVFGFNPYVTNMLNRGNPLYPIMGSKTFPKASDTNEKFETPKNMKGKNLAVRLFYANFGQPGNAPYNKEKDATLAWPFTTSPGLWSAYHFQETRVSGFGPYFGILLVWTIIVLTALLIAVKEFRWPGFVFLAGLCCCLSLSKHFWWPRFFPLLWLTPLLPLFLLWTTNTEQLAGSKPYERLKAAKIAGWLLAIIIGINGLIVAFVHMQWETASSVTLRMQLRRLRDVKRPIEVDYGVFKRSMEEKLSYWNIGFTPMSLKLLHEKSHKLTSVVKGYPNQVWYRIPGDQ